MTTREFIQHLILNCDLDDEVHIEVRIPDNTEHRYISLDPAHVTRIGEYTEQPETLIECKPYKED